MSKLSRREATKMMLAATVMPSALTVDKPQAPPSAKSSKTWDVAVIGAGAFGAWSAYFLWKAGLRVILLDAYGPANSRASSGGESRIIRTAYGSDDFYSRWALRSLPHWKSLAARCEQTIFHETGVLAISDGTSDFVTQSGHSLQRMNIEHEMLDAAQLVKHYPQIGIKPNDIGIFEPHSGTLMARRGIQVLVDEMVTSGLEYRVAAALPPSSKGPLNAITTASHDLISAGTFVFACGPWLPKVFPALLGRAVMPERAEVYFLGVAPGDLRFSPLKCPLGFTRAKTLRPTACPSWKVAASRSPWTNYRYPPTRIPWIANQPSHTALNCAPSLPSAFQF